MAGIWIRSWNKIELWSDNLPTNGRIDKLLQYATLVQGSKSHGMRKRGVIEVTENNQGIFTSYLKEKCNPCAAGDWIYLLQNNSKRAFLFVCVFIWWGKLDRYSSPIGCQGFIGWLCEPKRAAFFTGAFVGMANVDYSGYELEAKLISATEKNRLVKNTVAAMLVIVLLLHKEFRVVNTNVDQINFRRKTNEKNC